MRKILTVLMCLWACLLSACCGVTARERAFTDGVDQLVIESGLSDQHAKYVDADPTLKPESKKIRKETIDRLKALLAEQKKALKD